MYNGERRINGERKSVCIMGKKKEREREGGREDESKVYLTVFIIMIQNLDLFLYLYCRSLNELSSLGYQLAIDTLHGLYQVKHFNEK